MTHALTSAFGALALSLSITSVASAQAPIATPERPSRLSEGPLEPLNYFIGDWTIDATWSWGNRLRGRNEYRVGLNGEFLEVKTIVQDNEGPVYERYFSFYTYDKNTESFVAMGLNSDGSTSSLPHTLEVIDGLPQMEFVTTNPDGSSLRQILAAIDKDTCDWRVWMTAAGEETEQQIMEGQWERVTGDGVRSALGEAGQSTPRSIDTSTLAPGGRDVRSLTKTVEIDASTSDVFSVWSTVEGWTPVFGRERWNANFDLGIGGQYEWLIPGWINSSGCQILSYIPNRMISFTWNAPPNPPANSLGQTWVVVELDETESGGTRITLTHLGFGDGHDWDTYVSYYENAWTSVLSKMSKRLSKSG